MKIVVLGCGRVGARVASALDGTHDVTLIDWNPSAFSRLDAAFNGRTVLGNGIDVDVLREAGVDSVDVFLAMTNGDNRNIMAGQIARELGARNVVVRVYDPIRAEIFSQTGLTTISPTVRGVDRLFDMLVGGEGR